MSRSKFFVVSAIFVAVLIGLATWLAYRVTHPSEHIDWGRAKLHSLQMKIAAYRIDTGVLPKNLDNLLTSNGVANWNGPYAKSPADLRDPWGREIQYEVVSTTNFRLSEVTANGSVSITETYETRETLN